MKKILILCLGLAAAAAFIAAMHLNFATVPMAGTVMFSETSFAGSGRLWVLAVFGALAGLAGVAGRASCIAPVFSSLGLGMLADIGIAAWDWRAEKLDLLKEMNLESIANAIQYGPGGYVLAAGGVLLLAHLLVSLCCCRRQ